MISWTEEEYNNIIISDEFNKDHIKYKEKEIKLSQFLKTISLNKKYFRLTTNNKIGKNIHYKNKNISKDTRCHR